MRTNTEETSCREQKFALIQKNTSSCSMVFYRVYTENGTVILCYASLRNFDACFFHRWPMHERWKIKVTSVLKRMKKKVEHTNDCNNRSK